MSKSFERNIILSNGASIILVMVTLIFGLPHLRNDGHEPRTIAFVEGLRKKLPSFQIGLGVLVTFQSALNWVQEKK